MSECYNTAKPLSVDGLIAALDELKQQCSAEGRPIALSGPVYLRHPSIDEREFVERLFAAIADAEIDPDGRTS